MRLLRRLKWNRGGSGHLRIKGESVDSRIHRGRSQRLQSLLSLALHHTSLEDRYALCNDRVGSTARQEYDVTGNEGLWEEKAMKSKLTDSMAFNWTSRLCLAQSSVITSRMSPDVLNTIIMTGDG